VMLVVVLCCAGGSAPAGRTGRHGQPRHSPLRLQLRLLQGVCVGGGGCDVIRNSDITVTILGLTLSD
jgi:hypothetical protein